jgi:hypothetical protein
MARIWLHCVHALWLYGKPKWRQLVYLAGEMSTQCAGSSMTLYWPLFSDLRWDSRNKSKHRSKIWKIWRLSRDWGKKKSVNVLLRACLVETTAEKGASYLAVGQWEKGLRAPCMVFWVCFVF